MDDDSTSGGLRACAHDLQGALSGLAFARPETETVDLQLGSG
jgi:hypothetical protein